MIDNPIQFEKWDQWCECLGQHVSTRSCPKNLRDTIQRLRAENERLREALEKIASAPYPDTRFNGRGMLPDFDGFKPIARAALGEEKKG